jgi:hypothetical protein
MDLIEIEQHKLIVEKGKELLKVCFKSEIDYLQNLIDDSKSKIDEHNNRELTVFDITQKEKGIWNRTVNGIIWYKYYKPILNKNIIPVEDFIPCEDHAVHYTYEGNNETYYDEEKYCEDCRKKCDEEDKAWEKNQKTIERFSLECKDACRKTIFSEDLMLKYILLIRKGRNRHYQEPLLLAIKATIRTEILKTFQEQNQKSITKYI